MSGVAMRDVFFSLRSGHNSKHPSEMDLHCDDSVGKPREPCKKYSRSREVHRCRFMLISFLGVHSRGLAMSITCITEIGHLVALSIGFSSCTMNFLLSRDVRPLSSHSFPTDIRAGPTFEMHFCHALFWLDIEGRFGNEPFFVGVMVLPLVRPWG